MGLFQVLVALFALFWPLHSIPSPRKLSNDTPHLHVFRMHENCQHWDSSLSGHQDRHVLVAYIVATSGGNLVQHRRREWP